MRSWYARLGPAHAHAHAHSLFHSHSCFHAQSNVHLACRQLASRQLASSHIPPSPPGGDGGIREAGMPGWPVVEAARLVCQAGPQGGMRCTACVRQYPTSCRVMDTCGALHDSLRYVTHVSHVYTLQLVSPWSMVCHCHVVLSCCTVMFSCHVVPSCCTVMVPCCFPCVPAPPGVPQVTVLSQPSLLNGGPQEVKEAGDAIKVGQKWTMCSCSSSSD